MLATMFSYLASTKQISPR